ncbi:DUF1569 domain-containing protein [uncultured Algibacter sp.]|uniref:DUF1569 domain-containing protein n=1 Tax=uncultured Algibacter sp. TaxID=298659 RepID=UPI0030ED7F42|tara:strand:- start:962 stop:1435 length:474 start_codon:yes stop_codon:yes gene_type:complete
MSNKRITILKNQLSKLESFIPLLDKENLKVSKSTVGWQLDHALKVFNAVSKWTENSNPKEYKRKFNFWRSVLFPLGYFPRGKVRAPKYVLPPEIIKNEDLNAQLQTARTHIENLKTLPEKAYFKHFIFGMLSKKQTLRFLEMHTKHHLKIVNDILKK